MAKPRRKLTIVAKALAPFIVILIAPVMGVIVGVLVGIYMARSMIKKWWRR